MLGQKGGEAEAPGAQTPEDIKAFVQSARIRQAVGRGGPGRGAGCDGALFQPVGEPGKPVCERRAIARRVGGADLCAGVIPVVSRSEPPFR